MLLRKTGIFSLTLFALLWSSNPQALQLSGFSRVNPYSPEEKILDIDVAPRNIVNYRDKMRDNVVMLSRYAKQLRPDFDVIVHAADELSDKSLWEYGREGYNNARKEKNGGAEDPAFLMSLKEFLQFKTSDETAKKYNAVIDGIIFNNAFCGEKPSEIPEGIRKFSIDKCADKESLDNAIRQSVLNNTLLYAFVNHKDAFKNVRHQMIINENAKNIYSLKDAQNVLFLVDNSAYNDKFKLIDDVRNSNFDIVVLPAFVNGKPFTKEEVNSLKYKKNGTLRKVYAVQNISEAAPEDYFWQKGWKKGNPQWIKRASFTNKNGYITQYWHEDWQKLMSQYFKGIVNLEFDGVVLTGMENYRYFEQQTPLD